MMSAQIPVQCTVVILREDFSVESMFNGGDKIAAEMHVAFQGTNVFTIPVGQTLRFFPTLGFQISPNQIDLLVQRLATELRIDRSLLREVVFRTQPVESGRPPPEGMIS